MTFGELSQNGVPHARDEAEFILMHILSCKRSELFLNARRELSNEQGASLRSALERRVKREPSQHIFGEAEFRGRSFKVTRDVLIPRPETELLVEAAVRSAASFSGRPLSIIDLCTGSGCIGISAAIEIKDCEVYATDISDKAIAIAKENALRLSVAEKVRFGHGDLFGPVPHELNGRVQMILSNPPYINEKDMGALEPEVRDFEPREALFGGTDGMDIIRRILNEAPGWLCPGGLLLMEIGYDQAGLAKDAALASSGYGHVEILKDYAGIGRILKASSKV